MTPFGAALGPQAEALGPRLREHFLQPDGTRRYRGTMRRVWRHPLAAPFLRLSSRDDLLFAETGQDVPFEVEHAVEAGRMTWTRTFRFPKATRVFHAVMRHDPERGLIDDRLGRAGRLEVELEARVEEGALAIRSRRQWLHAGRLRVRLPAWLAGRASIREWEEPDGRLGVRVVVSNPILGEVFGYEGSFARVD